MRPVRHVWCGCTATRSHSPIITMHRLAIVSLLVGNSFARPTSFTNLLLASSIGFSWHKPIFGAAQDITTSNRRVSENHSAARRTPVGRGLGFLGRCHDALAYL